MIHWGDDWISYRMMIGFLFWGDDGRMIVRRGVGMILGMSMA
jgi:hypothetical protein